MGLSKELFIQLQQEWMAEQPPHLQPVQAKSARTTTEGTTIDIGKAVERLLEREYLNEFYHGQHRDGLTFEEWLSKEGITTND